MSTDEQNFRNQLGIPNSANAVVILEPSSHLDWDWTSTFLDYYNGNNSDHPAVHDTYTDAITVLQKNQKNVPPYYYTFCEMSYLRQYLQDPNYPNQKEALQGLLDVISISGGGITSAENLVCHGEAFIRNYLLGRKWIADTLNVSPAELSVTQLWIPDDFGHDSQLPIVAQAMGFEGVAFERVPLDPNAPWGENATLAVNAPASVLPANKELDFIWMASDGSQLQAHWLGHGYCEGNPSALSGFEGSNIPWGSDTQNAFTQFVTQNQAVTNTTNIPYMFVPIDCDFNSPYLNLMEMVANWNACNGFVANTTLNPTCPTTLPVPGVYLMVAPFATFMKLVQLHTANGPGSSTLPKISFVSDPSTTILPLNPSYSGCYTSHPDLKKHHYAGTRELLAAESFETIVEYLAVKDPTTWSQAAAQFRNLLYENWNALVPSTHHDYVVGTAPDNVYESEQAPDLVQAHIAAVETRNQILDLVASAINASSQPGEQAVAVFNPTGIFRAGLVEMDSPGATEWASVRINSELNPIQVAANGKLLFLSGAGGFGYSTVYLSTQSPDNPNAPQVSYSYDSSANTYKLTNQYGTAEIGLEGIISLVDIDQNPLLGTNGNQIVFYVDGGGIYRFGNEIPGNASRGVTEVDFYAAPPVPLENPTIELIEDGAVGHLRVSVGVKGTFTVNNEPLEFQMVYSLVAGENLLRISTKGKAPSGYSVMVCFPFIEKITSLVHGTAYHWDTGYPRQYWTNNAPNFNPQNVEQLTFEATHEFVVPQAGETMLGAIYHASTPAWGIDKNGNVLGCILRNTPGNYNGAVGTDDREHLASYAIRFAGPGLQSPVVGANAGGPLGEALQFNNPLIGFPLPSSQTGSVSLNEQMSVASTQDPTAIVTAVKAGTMTETELILRVYNPTTSPLGGIDVDIDSSMAVLFQLEGALQVSGRTALELPLQQPLAIERQAATFTFTADYALTTLALEQVPEQL